MRITQTEFIIYLAIAGAIIGLLLGLGLLLLGYKKDKTKLGVIGLLSSFVGGPISPIISMVVFGVFTWLILKKPTAEGSNVSDISNGS
jgi:hypothetical protein